MIHAVNCFLWDCYSWCKVRLFPDRRPSAEILAEVKERLSQMPASKEIHEVYRLLEEVDSAPPAVKRGE